MRHSLVYPTSATLLALLACGGDDLTGPDRGAPAQYALEASYSCGQWNPAEPTVALGLFDLAFAGQRAGPSEDRLRAIVQAGGTIVHRFNVNMVRAILPPRRAAGLGAVEVNGVTDADDLTLKLSVGLHGGPDASILTARGGTVEWASSLAPYSMTGRILDGAVPQLRNDPRVRFVELLLGGCLLGTR